MCTAIERAMVKGEVQDLISKGAMFTGFDVTRILRIADPNVKHFIVKEAINDLFEDGEFDHYDRTLVNIPGVKTAVWVYHDSNDTPYSYDHLWLIKSQTVAITQQAKQAITKPSNVITISDYELGEVTGEGRLNLGPFVLSWINVCPGDLISLTLSPHHELLLKKGKSNLKTYRVDKDYRIRISDRYLRFIGNPKLSFLAENVGDGLTIKIRQ